MVPNPGTGKCSLDSDSDRIQWIFDLFCGSEQQDSADHFFRGELPNPSLMGWKKIPVDVKKVVAAGAQSS